jgi:hypothetical protein
MRKRMEKGGKEYRSDCLEGYEDNKRRMGVNNYLKRERQEKNNKLTKEMQ